MPLADFFNKVSNGSQALPTTLSADKNAGAATASLNAATGWDTTTAKHIRMYKTKVVNGSTVPDTTLLCYYKATLSGTTLSSITLVYSSTGIDQKFVIGDSVDLSPTTRWADDLMGGMLVEHTQTGTHGAVTATSLVASGTVQGATVVSTGDIQLRSTSLETIQSNYVFDFVASGCVLTGTGYGTTLGWSLTSGVVYINGKRFTVAAATGVVVATKDTYFDLLDPGTGTVATLVFTGVNSGTVNAASPALAASSVRMAIIQSGATIVSVASVNQGEENKVLPIASSIPYAVTDSLGNLICPRDSQRKILGYRQIIASPGTITTIAQIIGLSCPVIVPTGRKVRVTLFINSTQNNTGGGYAAPSVWDGAVSGGTQLARTLSFETTATGPHQVTTIAVATPTTANKTYNAGCDNVGTGTVSFGNLSATSPLFIMVELA